jgi:uncharacterized protein YhdP
MAYLSAMGASSDAKLNLSGLDFFFNRALIFGQEFNDLSFNAVGVEDGLIGVITSSSVAGHISLPKSNQSPTTLDLDYFYYHSGDEESADKKSETNDAKRTGPLNVNVRSFYRDNKLLGRVNIELIPEAHGTGMSIRRADISGAHLDLRAKGAWHVAENGEQQTTIEAKVDTKNMGKLLGLLGYVDNLGKGEAHNLLYLTWDGGFNDFALEKLNGEIIFDIGQGVLLDIDPGAGRIFGLLSIQALPRRLSLDFSDFFTKGLAFDFIRGKVKLQEGEAYTEDLRLEGPSANILITGYIDLVGKKYNQYVTVEPNYTGTLPLAVAVIANPAAGVAAWFAEKLLRRPVNDIAKILYHVTGSWDAPDIKRLGRLEYSQQVKELLSK